MGLDYLVEAAAEFTEAGRVYGGVLDKGDGLGIAAYAHQEPEPRLAYCPGLGLVFLLQQVDAGVAEPLALHIGLEGIELGTDLGLRVAEEFDKNEAPGVALYEFDVAFQAQGGPGLSNDHIVDELDGGGRVFDYGGCGVTGLEDVIEVKGGHPPGVG